MGEKAKAITDRQLAQLAADKTGCLQACYTYFVQDAFKFGGTYETAVGAVKKLDELNRCVALADGRVISVNDLLRKNS